MRKIGDIEYWINNENMFISFTDYSEMVKYCSDNNITSAQLIKCEVIYHSEGYATKYKIIETKNF